MKNKPGTENINVENLSYSYPGSGKAAIEEINAKFEKGKYYVILGRNGSGKSTLLRCLNSLLKPTSGAVSVCGLDSSNKENSFEILKRTSTVFQDPQCQIVGTTVEDDVAFGPENLGIKTDVIKERVRNALGMTGISDIAEEEPQRLSQGQQQLVSIAGALAMEPSFLLSDESTSMLDDGARTTVLDIFDKLKEAGIGIIHVTHFMEEAVDADEVLVLDEGKIRLSGSPGEVLSDPGRMLEMGLEPLPVTMVARELSGLGMSGPGNILTPKELISWLKG